MLSRLLVVDDWSSDPREAGLLDDTDIGTTVMQELFYLVDELTDFVNNFGSYKAFASPEEPVKNKIVSLIREAHLDLVKTVWLFGKTRAMLASILELPEFERLEAVVQGRIFDEIPRVDYRDKQKMLLTLHTGLFCFFMK